MPIPEFNRCCCCLPLRGGLVAAAILKLICFTALIISVAVRQFSTNEDHEESEFSWSQVMRAVVPWLLLITNVCSAILLLFGALARRVKALKVFMWLALVETIIIIFLSSVAFGNDAAFNAGLIVAIIVTLVIQAYLILCTRSLIMEIQSQEMKDCANAATVPLVSATSAP